MSPACCFIQGVSGRRLEDAVVGVRRVLGRVDIGASGILLDGRVVGVDFAVTLHWLRFIRLREGLGRYLMEGPPLWIS